MKLKKFILFLKRCLKSWRPTGTLIHYWPAVIISLASLALIIWLYAGVLNFVDYLAQSPGFDPYPTVLIIAIITNTLIMLELRERIEGQGYSKVALVAISVLIGIFGPRKGKEAMAGDIFERYNQRVQSCQSRHRRLLFLLRESLNIVLYHIKRWFKKRR